MTHIIVESSTGFILGEVELDSGTRGKKYTLKVTFIPISEAEKPIVPIELLNGC